MKKRTAFVSAAFILAASISGIALAKSGAGAQALDSAAVSATRAIDIATAKVKGTVTSVDFDYKKKAQTSEYEVDLKNGNEKYEVHIDAKTGAILGTQTEQTEKVLATQPAIPLKRAIEIALAKEVGKVKEAELKHKNNQLLYKVELKNGMQEKDVLIDANNGKILEVRSDS